MLRIVECYYIIFLVYACAGWTMESVGGIFKDKKFVNRGFLIGPYCPVYGVGVVLLDLLLDKYKSDLVILFFLSIFVCATLEYFTGFIMEKFFNARWWDYSKMKFNINGRICLETSIPFGLGGCLFLRFVNPFIFSGLDHVPDNVLTIITGIIAFLMFIDFIISFVIINSFKNEVREVKDNTDEIVKKVKDTTIEIANNIELNTKRLARVVKLNTKAIKHNVRFYSKKTLKKISIPNVKEIIENRKNQLQHSIAVNKLIIQDKFNRLKEEKLNFMKEKFIKKSRLHERLINAFPNFDIKSKFDIKSILDKFDRK